MAKPCTDGRRFNRPPEKTRFKPGQSGNRKGRPKKQSRETSAREACCRSLDEVVAVVDGRGIAAFEAALLQVRNKAVKQGDMKALREWLAICERYGALVPSQEDPSGERLTGVLVVPPRSETIEDWERDHGEAASGRAWLSQNPYELEAMVRAGLTPTPRNSEVASAGGASTRGSPPPPPCEVLKPFGFED